MVHVPVLQKEVIKYLTPESNQNFIDCTIGEGGHALAIIEKILPKGKLLGIDWNPELIRELKIKYKKARFKKNLILVYDNFSNLKEIVKRYNFKQVLGILFDLGISSWHLKESKGGFSFLKNEPLDMRYNVTHFLRSSKSCDGLTAEKIINGWSEKKLEKIFKEYGEEKFSRRITREIVENRKVRKIGTTLQLVEIIKRAVPSWYRHKKIHFATKSFQALRIAVNDELKNLEKALPQALEILKPQGKLIIISFHSLEDRISKNFLRDNSKQGLLKILTKKPKTPTKAEIFINPRSRSAKLRVAIKL
ncbi:16S rRNA (cytosine(1402)-N(4))-methyltransferase RsmH [Patescibacteria group bacterium]|nr:16S rRNA (cytosine(1402)-N(4))-methyltransferase RsmH [Patescibacteria group bacterium]